MRIENALSERRTMIARQTLALVNHSGPLSAEQRQRLVGLRQDMDDLEQSIAHDGERRYASAFRSYLRHGMVAKAHQKGVTGEERSILETRDMGSASGGAGISVSGPGILVPVGFISQVTSAMKFAGPMSDPDLVTVVDTERGNVLPFPMDNDTTVSGEQLPEGEQATAQDIAAISSVTLRSFKYSSRMVKITAELLQDNGIDIESYLAQRLGVRLGRILNSKFSNGTGSGEPFGVVGQAVSAGAAQGAFLNDGISNAGTLGTADFSTLESALDPLYRRNARWMVHPNTLAVLRRQLDKNGRPVYAGLQSGGEDSVFNYPLIVNPQMAALPSVASSPPVSATTLLFGDFSRYVVRRVRPMLLRLDERFSDFGQVAFILWWRQDGNLIDGNGHAVVSLTTTY